MKPPLGMTEKDYEKRNKGYKYWKQFSAWRKGFKAGRKKKSLEDNPYKLSPETWELLRKRTRWILGFEEAHFTPSKKRLKEEAEQYKKAKRSHKHDTGNAHKSKRSEESTNSRKHRRKNRHSHS
jgi:hypothetical protein